LIVIGTDVLIDILDKESNRGKVTLDALEGDGDEVWTTALNLHEILYGLLKTSRPTEGLVELDVLPFSPADAKLSSEIEVDLERKGLTTRRMDVMIAAIAINHAARFLTYNTKHFERIKEFGLEFFPGEPDS
jgi:tRNA(fMet)-specific endonuclease VapC